MNRISRLAGGAMSVAIAAALATGVNAQAGPGASVEWSVGPGATPIVFFDSPPGYDRHYRVCFKKAPDTTSVEVVLADRAIKITNEDCVDVISNKISIRMLAGSEPATGIFYLVQ